MKRGSYEYHKKHTEADKYRQKNIYHFEGKDIKWQDNNLSINTC